MKTLRRSSERTSGFLA